MNSNVMIAAAVFCTVLGFVLAVASLSARRSTRLQSRLSRYALPVSTASATRGRRLDLLAQPFARAPSFLNRTLGRLPFVMRSEPLLVHANVRFGTVRFFLLRLLLAAIVFAAVRSALGGVLLAIPAAVVGYMIPRLVMSIKASRRLAAFEGQLAETLDLLVGSLRAGQGLLQAMESSSYEQPEPMRSELRRIVTQINMGIGINEAMEMLTMRFDSRDVELLAAAIAINRETGGNLTEVLERLAKTVRLRREIRAEAKSLTAAPRATSYILAVLPLIIASYCIAISPIYREQLLHNPLGRLLLVGACVWSLIGFFISQRLAKAEY